MVLEQGVSSGWDAPFREGEGWGEGWGEGESGLWTIYSKTAFECALGEQRVFCVILFSVIILLGFRCVTISMARRWRNN